MPPACGVIYFRFWAATSLGCVCTGLGFQSDGARQSCPQGPHSRDAPLGMINEPADSRNAAQLLWGAGMRGAAKRVFSPIPASVTEDLPFPLPCQTIAWHFLAPGRSIHGDGTMQVCCSPASRTLRQKELGRAICPSCCLEKGF